MTYILFIWTVVAGGNSVVARDWRPLAEFSTNAMCEDAARQLTIQERYRCVRTK